MSRTWDPICVSSPARRPARPSWSGICPSAEADLPGSVTPHAKSDSPVQDILIRFTIFHDDAPERYEKTAIKGTRPTLPKDPIFGSAGGNRSRARFRITRYSWSIKHLRPKRDKNLLTLSGAPRILRPLRKLSGLFLRVQRLFFMPFCHHAGENLKRGCWYPRA